MTFDIMSMSFKDAQKLLEELDHNVHKINNPYDCEDCEVNLVDECGMWYCPECGIVQAYGIVEEFVHGQPPPSKRSIYKRRLYCQEKIRSLCGNKVPNTAAYRKVKRKLNMSNFTSIIELKQLLKKLKYTSYYKHLYGIWYDLKGTKLIELTPYQQDMLAVQFVDLDMQFKQDEGHKRSNIMSYASMLYYLMKKNNYDGWKHIILPYNNVKIMRLIRSLDK